jgi:hypothetical protein
VVGVRDQVVKTDIVIKCIWPKLETQFGASKHGSEGVTNGAMGTFSWAFAVGQIGGGGLDVVAGILKQHNDGMIFAKLPATIKSDIFAIVLSAMVNLWQTIAMQPFIKELQWGRLGTETTTTNRARIMISDNAIARLTMQTL